MKLSIVIPVYNAALYITACLDSIYSQCVDENDFELICVNDCSPDNSQEIVLEYKRTHNNLRLIEHAENRKAGGARNTGVDVAQGEWIWFVDADDTIEQDALKKVLYHCRRDNLDALCFNYQLVYEDRTVGEQVFDDSSDVQSGENFLINTFADGIIYHLGYPVRTIYRRSVLLDYGIRFPEQLLYGEDTTFMAEAIMYSRRVTAISDVLYNYRQDVSTSSSAQLAEMKGERIFESIFSSGDLVLRLMEKAKEHSTQLAISIEKGLPWFVNRLFMRLIKTSASERRIFYNLTKQNTISSSKLLNYMNKQNYFIVKHQLMGSILLNILAFVYKISR